MRTWFPRAKPPIESEVVLCRLLPLSHPAHVNVGEIINLTGEGGPRIPNNPAIAKRGKERIKANRIKANIKKRRDDMTMKHILIDLAGNGEVF